MILLSLMICRARAYVCHLDEGASTEENVWGSPRMDSEPDGSVDTVIPSTAQCNRKCRPLLANVVRAIKAWSPEHVPSCSPYIVCTLIGPYASLLGSSAAVPDIQKGNMERELLALTITRFAKYWVIGSMVLGLWVLSLHMFS